MTTYRQRVNVTQDEDFNVDYVHEMLDSIEGRVTRILNRLTPIEGLTEINAVFEMVRALHNDLQ